MLAVGPDTACQTASRIAQQAGEDSSKGCMLHGMNDYSLGDLHKLPDGFLSLWQKMGWLAVWTALEELVLPGWQSCYESRKRAMAQSGGHGFGLASKVGHLLCQAQVLA